MFVITLIISFIQFDSLQTLVVSSSQQLFTKAVSLSIGIDGTVYVIDQSKNTLCAVSEQNTVNRSVGGKGWGSESFDQPSDVSSSFLLDILVSDASNMRIQRYDHQFNYIRTYDGREINAGSDLFIPLAVSTSVQGDLFILERDRKRVIVLDSRGVTVREIGNFNESKGKLVDPKDIGVSSENMVYILDGSTVIVYDIFGNFIRSIQLSEKKEYRSISTANNIILVTSSSSIEMIDVHSNKQLSFTAANIMGAEIVEPFTDALIYGPSFIILTHTTLYRCSIPSQN